MIPRTKTFTEFPVQMAFSSVVMPQPNVLKIESLIGLVVYCRLDVFSCNVTVSGYYHNKTLGKIESIILGVGYVSFKDKLLTVLECLVIRTLSLYDNEINFTNHQMQFRFIWYK